ncbi:amino acid adenylation domain-containing protein [Kutzneria viridogrisea]|uniref:Amino acid adenylation domain-containing protein n=1 Tax=Kutzneria viridogrisea TaxID=47990 RepID=A0ABR6BML8_9PSEU|nr:amino acid adenylation domain-containing protein [Kutzneria viridogrisea]
MDNSELGLHARFLRGLAVSPDRDAVRVAEESITYRAAHELALTWAGSMLAACPDPPRAVGVLTERGVHSYVAILACLYAGAAVVPLQPDFPAARTRQMLDSAQVSALVADLPGLRAVPGADVPVLLVGEVPEGERPPGSTLPSAAHALDRPRAARGSDPAYLLFTSGSTGRPKGVPISHDSTTYYFDLLDRRYDFGPEDVFSQTFDLNFDCAMFDLFCAWGAGATLVWVPPLAYRELPRFLLDQGVTVWFATPSAISLVRRMGGLDAGTLPGLRWSFFAGEALQCQDTADWQRAAPGSLVENLYGPTELTITITGHRWSEAVSPKLAVNGVVPIGAPHPGHEVLLIDAQDRPVAEGADGELCVTGPQLTRGYLDPAEDEGRFLEHGGRRWYRTGDRVRWVAEGELAYLGRMDAQVQVQGWRVELAEIDHALRGCAGVQDAVTVAVTRAESAELVVFYTGVDTPPAGLVRQLREVLPERMIPRRYHHLEQFPLNSNRKVDRGVLRARAADLLTVC